MSERNLQLNVIIIDDEIEACDNLKNILHTYIDPNINVMGMAYDTTQAEQLINRLNPVAVFLDIEMPDENAFQFLERIKPIDFEIIFVTAYDHFAIKAFKLNAIDYILKPISIEELGDAVRKLKEKLSLKQLLRNTDHQIETLKQLNGREKQHRIALKNGNEVELIDFKDIYFIEAQGSYCKFRFSKNNAMAELIISNTIAEYEELLPTELFYRVHKSYLVNCMHVEKIKSEDTYEIITTNGYKIPISRRRYATFIEFLKNKKFI